jgi:hypothetical protein
MPCLKLLGAIAGGSYGKLFAEREPANRGKAAPTRLRGPAGILAPYAGILQPTLRRQCAGKRCHRVESVHFSGHSTRNSRFSAQIRGVDSRRESGVSSPSRRTVRDGHRQRVEMRLAARVRGDCVYPPDSPVTRYLSTYSKQVNSKVTNSNLIRRELLVRYLELSKPDQLTETKQHTNLRSAKRLSRQFL